MAAVILAAEILAEEDISETISAGDTLAGSISAADMTIFGADITPVITAVGPDGALATTMVTMVIIATGLLVTGFGNGIIFMGDG